MRRSFAGISPASDRSNVLLPVPVDPATPPGGEAMRELAHSGSGIESQIDTFKAPAPFDEDLCRAVYQYVGDSRVIHERLQQTEPKELRAKCLELTLGQIERDGSPNALAQHRSSSGGRVQREDR